MRLTKFGSLEPCENGNMTSNSGKRKNSKCKKSSRGKVKASPKAKIILKPG